MTEYGVTAHIMNEFVDNGEIIEVRRFGVSPFDNLPSVLKRTHTELYNLCMEFIDGIYLEGDKFLKNKRFFSKAETWRGRAKKLKDLDALKNININVSERELKRLIRATYIENYPPVLELHGFKFQLTSDENDKNSS